ncbi:MAG: MoaD/ThiS family protein [Myxococcota bacterium]|jgi:molybdopterin synthase sulfur carrier subunit|nr:MoaD/ThiS family protein [Myxococcota bacterium]
MIEVKFYSHLRRVLGERSVDLEAATVGAVLDELSARFGDVFVERLPACKVFVNGSNVGLARGRRTRLHPGDEVILMPPVGGG